MKINNKKGFTLVELIAIIIIISLILAIIVPTSLDMIEKSRINSYREGLRSIIRSAEIYMEENELKTLPTEGLSISELNIDNAEKYSGIIKYVNGEVFLENISDGRYCGNGSKDTLSIESYTEECNTN